MVDIDQIPMWKKFYATDIRTKDKVRCMKDGHEDSVFIFAKGKRNRGFRYPLNAFNENFEIEKGPDEEKLWKKRVKKAEKALKESGLWPDLLSYLQNLEKVSWEDKQKIRDLSWIMDKQERNKAISGSRFQEKYPFLFWRAEDGSLQIDTQYVYEMSDVRLKTMYFGKYQNRSVKQDIAHAIRNGISYSSGRIRAGYDVSFSFKADDSKAWYQEEYRNCGNGHYYLAISDQLAWFAEND